jgi:CRISPR/Cas system-associated endoribonuclease Cas2
VLAIGGFMKILCSFFLICLFSMIGCAAPMYQATSSSPVSKLEFREEIQSSLFESDNSEISQEAVDKLLSGKIEIPDNIRITIYKMPNSYSVAYKYYGYSSEERLDTEQEIFQTVYNGISNTEKIQWIKPLPSILSPNKSTISKLREAAVRLQSDILVIYSVSSDIFTDYNVFSKNEVKAFSTCEMIAFDTKTGVIPFSEVKTKKVIEKELKTDANMAETRKRAEKKAVIEALRELSKQLSDYIKNS